jgi:hypothetical protein
VSAVSSEILAIAFFTLVGWIALWPVRHVMGPVAYHLAALPIGILCAPLAAGVSTLTGRPLDLLSAGAGGVVLVLCLWIVFRVVGARGDESGSGASGVGLGSFAEASGVMVGLAGLLGFARLTVTNNDSFIAYWPLALQLSRKGDFTVQLIATRSPLIPAMGAIHATLGSDWTYVIYPMLGISMALWLALTLWIGPLAGANRRTRVLVAGGALLFLVVEPSFLFHSFLVHSHMVSALYLLMSLTCLWLARAPRAGTGSYVGQQMSYLVLGGAFTAGLILSRPDGLAYGFVPVAVAIAVLASPARRRAVAAYFAPLFFIVLGTYAAAYAHLGIWSSTKLTGRAALAILAMLALSAAGPWIVDFLDRRLPFRFDGERFLGILASAAGIMTLGAFALKWESAQRALATAGINLFGGAGGYSYLWYAAAALLAVSFFSRDALRAGSWTRWAFLSIAMFFIIAGLVHGTSHPGRIGPGDSLNRVVFHVIPVLVWYGGAMVARILGRPKGAEAS